MKEFKGTSTTGKTVVGEAFDDGSILLDMEPFVAGDSMITLDAASVAKLRDWLVEDCCDMRRAK